MNHAAPRSPEPTCPRPRPSKKPAVGHVRSAGLAVPSVQAETTVQLIWADPVTGERLRVTMDASPEMIRRLEGEGFYPDAEITRTAS